MTREKTRVDPEIPGAFGSRRARMLRTMTCALAVASWLSPGVASAQPSSSEPWTVEAVVSGSANSLAPGDPFLIFDLTGTGRLHDGLDVIVRPYAHRLTGGDWTAEMYQLQLRYVVPTRIPLRLDAGIIASPLGLNTLELIAAKNPTIGAPFFYFAPLPRFDAHYDGVQLISGGYPLGAIVSSSGSRWDVRAGVTDQSPTHRRNVLGSDRPGAARQLVAGAGYTPWKPRGVTPTMDDDLDLSPIETDDETDDDAAGNSGARRGSVKRGPSRRTESRKSLSEARTTSRKTTRGPSSDGDARAGSRQASGGSSGSRKSRSRKTDHAKKRAKK
jgi:hypothetical protein